MNEKTLVLFDFDGTLTYRDSSEAFYQFLYKSKIDYFFFNYVLCLKEALFLKLNIFDYLNLKKRRLHVHTSRFNDYQLQGLADEFRKKEFNNILIPNALIKLFWHKKEGHEIWIVSASYDFILDKWAAEVGVKLLTNRTFLDKNSRVLLGKDLNFEEKVNAVKNSVNLKEYKDIYAYGDSEGDNQMLEIATKRYYKYFY
jgi:phosphatidylglycerophosphatase C